MDRANNAVAPVCLTIAGFDPSGGAGILADSRTFSAFGCTPTAAITSLTFQNDRAVFGARHQSPATVREQVEAIVAQSQVVAVKTGMLPTAGIICEVVQLIREAQLPAPVVDPVLQSTSGFQLMEPEAIEVLLTDLMPLARIITPNIPEAEQLTGLQIENENDMHAAARRLREKGARAVLIKGGHLSQWSGVRDQGSVRSSNPTVREGSVQAIDVLDDEGRVTLFRGEWIDAPPVRGTGCTLSAAIAACLADGMKMEEAIGAAKSYITNVIRTHYFGLRACNS